MLRQFILALTVILLVTASGYSDDEHPSAAAAVSEALELAETILNHHVLPPTRQEMLLRAQRNAYREAGTPGPLDLSRRFSDAASFEELRNMMVEQSDALLQQGLIREDQLTGMLREGLLASVSGEVRLADADEERVAEQFRSNRYVGTGIALRVQDGIPIMAQVFPGGPAHSVGALDGDRIELIDGESTGGMSIQEVIKLLRGPEGSDVVVALRQPDEEEQRVLTITRGVVPLESITGYELFSAGGDAVVAYVRIERLSASCVHELRQVREKIERDGARGLIVDLRETESGRIHDAVLLADAFLDGEEIGRVRTLTGNRTYVAESGELFPDLKIGLLVGRGTWDTVEWVAAALQDAGRAVVFGDWTPGRALASDAIPYGGDQVLIVPTALLERPSGQPLLRSRSDDHWGPATPPFETPTEDAGSVEKRMRVPWGILPDVFLPTRTAQQIVAMPASAAHRLPDSTALRSPVRATPRAE